MHTTGFSIESTTFCHMLPQAEQRKQEMRLAQPQRQIVLVLSGFIQPKYKIQYIIALSIMLKMHIRF